MKDIFKEIIPSIMQTSEYVLEDESDEKSYNSFLINKSLSNHIDCIFHSANMNRYHQLDNKMQYDYYFHILKKYKRPYQKWLKYTEPKELILIRQYYECSLKKAKEIYSLLNKEQIEYIRQKLDIGGNSSNNK